jgi:hypothetical protein
MLRNETHAEFIIDFSDIVKRIGAGSIGITALMPEFELRKTEELNILDIYLKSNYTVRIKEKDRRRDNTFRGFSLAVDAATHHPDAAVRAAGKAIKATFKHYGKIPDKNYDDASAAYGDLFRELDTAENKALLAAAGLTNWQALLKTENDEFIALMHARDTEVSQRPDTSMKEARAEVDKLIHAILARVEAQITLYGMTSSSSDYKPFVDEWNTLAERYKRRLAIEKGRRAAKRNEEKEEEEA